MLVKLNKELDAAITEYSKLDGPFSELVKLLSSCKAALSEQEPVACRADLENELQDAISGYFQVGFRHGEQKLYHRDDEQYSAQNALTKIQELITQAFNYHPQPQKVPQSVGGALREIASWLDYGTPDFTGGPTYHEADMIGMEISGPTGCGDASACLRAARKAFLVAADIWERSKVEALEEQL